MHTCISTARALGAPAVAKMSYLTDYLLVIVAVVRQPKSGSSSLFKPLKVHLFLASTSYCFASFLYVVSGKGAGARRWKMAPLTLGYRTQQPSL